VGIFCGDGKALSGWGSHARYSPNEAAALTKSRRVMNFSSICNPKEMAPSVLTSFQRPKSWGAAAVCATPSIYFASALAAASAIASYPASLGCRWSPLS